MSSKNEPVHLCPICVCVEMKFVERVPNSTTMRTRRFKCPVCDHSEMYLMSGPNDAERAYDKRIAVKAQKEYQYKKRKDLF